MLEYGQQPPFQRHYGTGRLRAWLDQVRVALLKIYAWEESRVRQELRGM
jgi:hypothetical protein